MVESDQPNEPSVLAVLHLVVADMPEKAAYGRIDQNGEPVVYADRGAMEGDPQARENTYKVVTALFATLMEATTMSVTV